MTPQPIPETLEVGMKLLWAPHNPTERERVNIALMLHHEGNEPIYSLTGKRGQSWASEKLIREMCLLDDDQETMAQVEHE